MVHADRNRLSVIDLDTLETISDQPISQPQSILDRLFTWLVPPAQAKLSRGTTHTAVLGPDGLLYVASSITEAEEQADGEWRERTTPIGLRVIDSSTAVEVDQLDVPVDQVMVSPDGPLVATGTSRTYTEDGADSTPSGVYIIEPDPVELTYHLIPGENEEWSWLEGISPDGDVAYVQTGNRDADELTLHAIDIHSGQTTGSYVGLSPYIIPELGLLPIPRR